MVDEAKGDKVHAEKKLADATGQVTLNYNHLITRDTPPVHVHALDGVT